MTLDEIEARLDDTIFAKAGDKASEYMHPAHVRLLIRAVRQLGVWIKTAELDAEAWPEIEIAPDVLGLLEEL